MKTIALGEAATIERVAVDPTQLDPETRYLGLEHIERGGAIVGYETVGGAELTSTKFRFTADQVLFGKLRPYLAKIALPEFSGVCSTDILPISPRGELDRRYLAHYLRAPSVVDFASSRATGANLPRLSPSVLASLEVPLPPLAEQRRIAAILDHADALRAKRRASIALTDDAVRSAFDAMFGLRAPDTNRLRPSRLGNHVRSMQYGPRFYNEPYSKDGIRIVRITDLDQVGRLDFDAMPKMSLPEHVEQKYRLTTGDILFARTGATVGKVALMGETAPACVAGAYFIRIKLDSSVLPEYVVASLRSPQTQRIIWTKSHQSAQQNFSGPGLRELPLAVPPLELQREFAGRVAAINVQRAAAERSLASLDELFASLQARAFSGQL